MDPEQLKGQYEDVGREVGELTELVKELAGHSDLEGLEEEIVAEDYL